MKPIIEQLLVNALHKLKSTGKIPVDINPDVKVERTKNTSHGNFSSNLALVMPKYCQQSSDEIAHLLVKAMDKHTSLEKVDIVKPGFINFFMHNNVLSQVVATILNKKEQFGHTNLGKQQKVIIEFVSSNPTGPLHVGHGRGAAFNVHFDLDLAKSQSSDNPVYYIQYAHARISSVLYQLQEYGLYFDETMGLLHLELLTESYELTLLTLLNRYPDTIVTAASRCEPHQLAYYLCELANGLHSYYNALQLLCNNLQLRNARLCLLVAVRQVFKNGLRLLGVSAPESM